MLFLNGFKGGRTLFLPLLEMRHLFLLARQVLQQFLVFFLLLEAVVVFDDGLEIVEGALGMKFHLFFLLERASPARLYLQLQVLQVPLRHYFCLHAF